METTKTIDNVSCRLGDDIAGFLTPDACVYVSSNGFSLSAFEHLADELESVKEIRFVFTAPAFLPQSAVKEKIKKERREFFIPGVGEALKDFIARHYRIEALRGELAIVEKKLSVETQLDVKYQLSKKRQRILKEIGGGGNEI